MVRYIDIYITTTLAVLFLDCCVLELGWGYTRVVSGLPASANVVVQQHSRKLLKMDILMPETC